MNANSWIISLFDTYQPNLIASPYLIGYLAVYLSRDFQLYFSELPHLMPLNPSRSLSYRKVTYWK